MATPRESGAPLHELPRRLANNRETSLPSERDYRLLSAVWTLWPRRPRPPGRECRAFKSIRWVNERPTVSGIHAGARLVLLVPQQPTQLLEPRLSSPNDQIGP